MGEFEKSVPISSTQSDYPACKPGELHDISDSEPYS